MVDKRTDNRKYVTGMDDLQEWMKNGSHKQMYASLILPFIITSHSTQERTVNRRSCYNLVLKLSRDLARGAMAKPSDRLSNLRNPWVEVFVFWSSMRASSMKAPWWHTAGWLNPHPAIAPQWPTDGSWSILCFQSGDPGLAPTTQHWLFCSSCSILNFLILMSINIQWWCLPCALCIVSRHRRLITEIGALVGKDL